ncbi:MAG: hypothetical protein mread185_000560 [Mycoplasmataceae bacterium]|nr:MAG: hypothetical protein mread185_000560 [Mycoplasmataceae bacterium]
MPNPNKLRELVICHNIIQPTTLDFLRPFVNLKEVSLGIREVNWKMGKCNKFYGSLEPCKYLTQLEELWIAGTDIDSGLEYLPKSLVQRNKRLINDNQNIQSNNAPDCQPIHSNAKVKIIQDQLRPFNYDLEAWRLANKDLVNSADRINHYRKRGWWISTSNSNRSITI